MWQEPHETAKALDPGLGSLFPEKAFLNRLILLISVNIELSLEHKEMLV